MPKHVKDPDDLSWPKTDEDELYRLVMGAFRGTDHIIPGETLINIYDTMFHDVEMTRWTAKVSTVDITGRTYHELYYDGNSIEFLTSGLKEA